MSALEISCFTCRYNGTGLRVCGECVNLSRYDREPERWAQRKEGS